MKTGKAFILSLLMAFLTGSGCNYSSSGKLEKGFLQPPEEIHPWTYWFFYNDHISREGIDLDLEAMKEAGIGTALLFTHVSMGGNTGQVKALTDEWWDLVKYAIRRAGEEGIDIGLFNCFGWSQSGGPWNKPEQSMRHLLAPEIRVNGPEQISLALPAPEGFFQDVRVLAFPTPAEDRSRILSPGTGLVSEPAAEELKAAFDGDSSTVFPFPESALGQDGSFRIDIRTEQPFRARSLQLHPSDNQFLVDCDFQYKDSAGAFVSIRKFHYQRPPGGGIMDIGPLHNGPASIAFPAISSDHFRLVFDNFSYHPHFGRAGSEPGFREIIISGAYRLDHYVEKQLSKVFPMPLPLWDSYLWEGSAPEDDPSLVIPREEVLDISEHLQDGILTWDVPGGEWTIMRICMVPTGAINAPVLPEAEGPEIDKLSRELAFHQFEGFAGRLIREIPANERIALKYLVIDSYEKGSQNWTDDLEIPFRETYGYDPIPYLATLSGRAVGSAEQSERFMWDLRRLIADRVSHEYVGGLREIANRNGLKLWVENYGHWGFPGEMLQYGGQADVVSGEFWTRGTLGSVELRAAASSAHTYGKKIVCAESFTSNAPHFVSHPWFFKLRGDWSFCEGVNTTLLTEYLHQPYTDRVPGVNAWFGTAFNRNNSWFFDMDPWVLYLRRCNFMLRQGHYVADLAYFIGEDAPKMSGITDPAPPPGYSYDLINGEVILEKLEVSRGRLVLPDGMSYGMLVLPPLDNMRPELLEKIRNLVRDGASIYGSPPTRSPSLQHYPGADQKVRELADEIWQAGAPLRGRVFHDIPLDRALMEIGCLPDMHLEDNPGVLWIHRSTGGEDIYFLSNQTEETIRINPLFRVRGKQPECWDAVSGKTETAVTFSETEQGTALPLDLGPRASVFVVFREKSNMKNRLPQGPGEKVIGSPDSYMIPGPWRIEFLSGRNAPGPVLADSLSDWSVSDDPAIRYYSGKARYTKTLDLPGTLFREGHTLSMDLGEVGNIAAVKINGKEMGKYWAFPMVLDVNGVLKAGENELEITVTSTLRNRLVGDALVPANAQTWMATDLELTGSEALIPSGLMGPVRIISGESASLFQK